MNSCIINLAENYNCFIPYQQPSVSIQLKFFSLGASTYLSEAGGSSGYPVGCLQQVSEVGVCGRCSAATWVLWESI